MNWFTRTRQLCLGLLAALALVFALTLTACGSPANAANSSAPASKPSSGTQQYQPASNTQSSNKATNADQQIQSLLRQLNGAQNDVNNADNGASQDGGQP